MYRRARRCPCPPPRKRWKGRASSTPGTSRRCKQAADGGLHDALERDVRHPRPVVANLPRLLAVTACCASLSMHNPFRPLPDKIAASNERFAKLHVIFRRMNCPTGAGSRSSCWPSRPAAYRNRPAPQSPADQSSDFPRAASVRAACAVRPAWISSLSIMRRRRSAASAASLAGSTCVSNRWICRWTL